MARYDTVDGIERASYTIYDASGNLRSAEQPNGMRVELDYDALGRIAEQRWMRHGVTSKILRILRSEGRVRELRDSTHAYQPELVHYDHAGRVVQIDYPIGLASRQLEYDLRDRQTATRYVQDGLQVRELEYEYDLADREVGVLDEGEYAWRKLYEGRLLAGQAYGPALGFGVELEYGDQIYGRVARKRIFGVSGAYWSSIRKTPSAPAETPILPPSPFNI